MLTKVKWTYEEDTTIKKLYKKKAPITEFQLQLKNRTASAIYSRIHTLKLKRDKKILPINSADFSTKIRKRELEKNTADIVAQKGGWFGIPGPAIVEHYETFEKILRAESPFIAVEENTMQFNKMHKAIEKYNKIRLIKGELFDVLKSYSKITPRIPLFSYGHLDFCKTTSVLIRDYDLLENLVWLSKWNQLKSEFYLDISASRRPDGEQVYTRFFQHVVPLIFEVAGWKVEDPRMLNNKFILKYRDGNPMVNALYKLTK